ncbi:MAG: amidase [Candidatus Cloacimonetes bacterium]|nr:amidase [Candidatus Cloacimonadota bacterium]
MNLTCSLPLKAFGDKLRLSHIDLIAHLVSLLDRIEENEPVIHSLLPEAGRHQRIMTEAKRLLKQYPKPDGRPPLFGVLAGIKDIINADGFETRAGSKLSPETFAGKEASIVTRLRQAGAIILGKTVSTEFAYFQPGETRNPQNTNHTPGGSSSGSAAAVAAGFCHLAIGTQTIASVIRPAAYCGVIGFKPSQGRISNDGIFPFSHSVDQVGFFAQDLDGIALACGVMCSDWKANDSPNRTQGAEGKRPYIPLRIGIPHPEYLKQSELLDHFQEVVDHLKSSGHDCIETDLWRDIPLINEMHNTLISREFYLNHYHLFVAYGSLYSKHSRDLFHKGRSQDSVRIREILAERIECRQRLLELMQRQQIDLWISPATSTDAPRGLASTGSPRMSLPWTFCGVPLLSIPVGSSANGALKDSAPTIEGMPFGLQLASAWNNDETLLSHARILAKSLNC